MREKLLLKVARWHASRPWRMLSIVTLLTVLFAVFAGQLEISTHTSDLLPSGDEKVKQFNTIIDEFATSTSLVVVVQGEEERIKDFADRLAPLILDIKNPRENESPMFQRVDYKIPVEFLKDHMLMLVEENDLANMKEMFTDPNLFGLITNINNSMEKEYAGREEALSTREEEDGAVSFLDSIQDLVLTLRKASSGENLEDAEIQAAAEKFLFGEPYFLSYDKTALILNAIPYFSLMDRDMIMSSTEAVQSIVDDLLKQFPDIQAGLSGSIAKEHDEQVSSQQSLGYTTLIAFIGIFILLIVSFRMWVAPLFAMLNLFVGLTWAMGAAGLLVGQLNLFTQTMSVLILGLGIDFSIHLFSVFTEKRASGESIVSAMEQTFLKSGKGILTGGITTAFAFFALVVSRARGMKEMGIVMGSGLLSILLATLLFLPILFVLRERWLAKRTRNKSVIYRDISFRFLGRTGRWLSQRYVYTILVSISISAILIWSAFQIEWDYDYKNMEPRGITSMRLMEVIMEKFDLSMDYALVLTEDIAESSRLAKKYRDLGTVAQTEDISLFLPTPEQQQKRIPHIMDVRDKIRAVETKTEFGREELEGLKSEIERLEMNIMEMQDMAFIGGKDKVDNKCKQIVGDPVDPDSINIIQNLLEILKTENPTAPKGLSAFSERFAPYFKQSVLRMSSTDPVHLDDLPVSILDRYSNRARNLFLITVYPAGSIYDGNFLNRFVDDVERISNKATGTGPLFKALLRIFGQDGRNAILLTLGVVLILLWIDFQSLRHALIAMIPLALGAFWMVGLMYLTGMKLSMMAVMGLPLIIGIGIDDGVHIMHRWRHEGLGKIRVVFSSTGKAILLTSLTTMFAFGSLVFSVFPALGQFGAALFIGVGACFLTTGIILPGLLGLIERRIEKRQNQQVRSAFPDSVTG